MNDTSKPLHSIWSWLIELSKSLSKYSSWKTPSSEFDNCKVSLARSSKPLQLRHASKGPVVQLKGSPWPSLSTSHCCDWPFTMPKICFKKTRPVSRKSFTSSAIHSWGAQVLSQLETEFTSVTPQMGPKAWKFLKFLCFFCTLTSTWVHPLPVFPKPCKYTLTCHYSKYIFYVCVRYRLLRLDIQRKADSSLNSQLFMLMTHDSNFSFLSHSHWWSSVSDVWLRQVWQFSTWDTSPQESRHLHSQGPK